MAPPHATFFRWMLAAKPPASSEKDDSRGPDGPRWGRPLNAYKISYMRKSYLYSYPISVSKQMNVPMDISSGPSCPSCQSCPKNAALTPPCPFLIVAHARYSCSRMLAQWRDIGCAALGARWLSPRGVLVLHAAFWCSRRLKSRLCSGHASAYADAPPCRPRRRALVGNRRCDFSCLRAASDAKMCNTPITTLYLGSRSSRWQQEYCISPYRLLGVIAPGANL